MTPAQLAAYIAEERRLLCNPPQAPAGRMYCAGCTRLVLWREGGRCPPCRAARQGSPRG